VHYYCAKIFPYVKGISKDARASCLHAYLWFLYTWQDYSLEKKTKEKERKGGFQVDHYAQ
jgi:hypothetical protein